MIRGFFVILLSALSACNSLTLPSSDMATPEYAIHDDAWTSIEIDGVTLSMQVPSGWQSIKNDYGILLAEYAALVDGGDTRGLLLYVFVPDFEEELLAYEELQQENPALAMLTVIAGKPEYVGNSVVSEPVSFEWSDHDAAYYLLSDKAGNHTLVLAVALPDETFVVCNISSSSRDNVRIREVLPDVLSTLTINAAHFDNTALHALPDPFVFPPVALR